MRYHILMRTKKVVLDTNVLYAGLYSNRGASHKVLRAIDEGRLRIVLSTTLLFEYEEALRSHQELLGLSDCQIQDVLDGLCAHGDPQRICFLWRPSLPDACDDHLLELAVASGVDVIVTHNRRHFRGTTAFGVRAVTPKQLLEEIE